MVRGGEGQCWAPASRFALTHQRILTQRQKINAVLGFFFNDALSDDATKKCREFQTFKRVVSTQCVAVKICSTSSLIVFFTETYEHFALL